MGSTVSVSYHGCSCDFNERNPALIFTFSIFWWVIAAVLGQIWDFYQQVVLLCRPLALVQTLVCPHPVPPCHYTPWFSYFGTRYPQKWQLKVSFNKRSNQCVCEANSGYYLTICSGVTQWYATGWVEKVGIQKAAEESSSVHPWLCLCNNQLLPIIRDCKFSETI